MSPLWVITFCTLSSLAASYNLPLLLRPTVEEPHPICNCTSVTYSAKGCKHAISNATTAFPAGVCTIEGSSQSTKVASNCSVAWSYSDTNCTGAPVFTVYANGKCNTVAGQWYRANCTREIPKPPTGPHCNCTSSSFSDARCTNRITNATTTIIPAGKCNKIGASSEKTATNCSVSWVYENNKVCSGTPSYVIRANGKCNQVGSFPVYYIARCNPLPPSPPPPPSGGSCICKSRDYTGAGCKVPVGNSTTTTFPRGKCVPLGTGGSEKMSEDCQTAMIYSGTTCSGDPIAVVRADGKCDDYKGNYYKATCVIGTTTAAQATTGLVGRM